MSATLATKTQQRDKNNVAAQMRSAFDLIGAGEFEKALKALDETEKYSGTDKLGAIHYARASALGHLGRFDEALEEIDKALDRASKYSFSAKAHAIKANLLRSNGNLPGALEETRSAMKEDSYCGDPHLYRGLIYSDMGLWKDAVEEFRAAEFMGIDMDRFGLGFVIALSRSGADVEASALFDRLIEAQPHEPDVYLNAIRHTLKRNRIDEAIGLIDRAQESIGDNPSLHIFRALLDINSGKANEALAELASIGSSEPTVVDGTLDILTGYLEAVKSKGDEAVVRMIGILDSMPRNLKTDSKIIRLYESIGEYGLISKIYEYWLLHGYGNYVKFYELRALALVKDAEETKKEVAKARSELEADVPRDQATAAGLSLKLQVFTDLAKMAEEEALKAAGELAERKTRFDKNGELGIAEYTGEELETYDFAE